MTVMVIPWTCPKHNILLIPVTLINNADYTFVALFMDSKTPLSKMQCPAQDSEEVQQKKKIAYRVLIVTHHCGSPIEHNQMMRLR